MIYAIADIHGLIWYLTKSPRLSKDARDAFVHAETSGLTIGVSAISIVEIVYLIEKVELLKKRWPCSKPIFWMMTRCLK